MKPYLKLVDTKGDGFKADLSPIFRDVTAFNSLIDDLSQQIDDLSFDFIVAIDAYGFILGTALSLRLQKGLVLVRKSGKLPTEVQGVSFEDYSGELKTLEISKGVLQQGMKVLIVDEWVETAASVRASIKLVEEQGATVAGIVAIGIESNDYSNDIIKNYPCYYVTDGTDLGVIRRDWSKR